LFTSDPATLGPPIKMRLATVVPTAILIGIFLAAAAIIFAAYRAYSDPEDYSGRRGQEIPLTTIRRPQVSLHGPHQRPPAR
jgi:hypothetical protein